MYPFQVDKEVKKDLWQVKFLQQRCKTSEKVRDMKILREKANLDIYLNKKLNKCGLKKGQAQMTKEVIKSLDNDFINDQF